MLTYVYLINSLQQPWEVGSYDHPFFIDGELRIEEVKSAPRGRGDGRRQKKGQEADPPKPKARGVGRRAAGKTVLQSELLERGHRADHLFLSLRFSVHLSLRDFIYSVPQNTPSFLTSPFLPQPNPGSPVLRLAP